MPRKKTTKKPEGKKAAFIADVHIGNHNHNAGEVVAGLNDRARVCLDVFKNSILTAKSSGAAVLFVAGDLFHVRRPEPALIAAVQHVLHEHAADLPVLIIPGNHDMLDATCDGGNTACAPLFQESTVVNAPEWITQTGLDMNFLCVPFQSKVPMREYLPAIMAEKKDEAQNGQRILVTHVGVYDAENAPSWCRLARDAISSDELLAAMSANGYTNAFVGNYHNHQRWTLQDIPGAAEITQVGTLIPHGYGDAGVFPLVGGIAFYDGLDVTMEEVKGPRFITVPDTGIYPSDDQWSGEGYTPYVRTDDPARAAALESTTGVKVEVVGRAADASKPDLPQVEDADSALAEYVGGLAIPPNVNRDDVMETVRFIWKQAAAG